MANAIEIEATVLLDEKEYAHIAKKIPFTKHVVPTNWYIDSKDRILARGATRLGLRIRFINGEYIFTLKAPLSEGLLEKEQLLAPSEADAMIKDNVFPEGTVKDFLEILDIDISKLETLAKLETERLSAIIGNFHIDLDKNSYLGRTDYELEVDSDSLESAQREAKNILKGRKVEFNLRSKQTRALKALEEQQALAAKA